MIRRREFITLLGGAAAWPLAAGAQQPNPMRRVGVFMNYSETDPEGQVRVAVLRQALEKLGWTVGRNLVIEYRWGVGDLDRTQVAAAAADLVRSMPEVILVNGGPWVTPLLQATRAIPIVFTLVSEPVALDFVASLARPGGNITGFTNLEPTIGSKWLRWHRVSTASRSCSTQRPPPSACRCSDRPKQPHEDLRWSWSRRRFGSPPTSKR